jgi:hypothetical protein
MALKHTVKHFPFELLCADLYCFSYCGLRPLASEGFRTNSEGMDPLDVS